MGRELQATAPESWLVVPCGSNELDVTKEEAVQAVVLQEQPSVIIHAAAYTDVDRAEREVVRAETVNVGGAANVARAAGRIGARMIYISTDFVFDGSQGFPYSPDAQANPLGVYGRSKLAGEREVAKIMGGVALTVRTAWVYSTRGRNFVSTMLRLMRDRDSVGVVCDQVGTPTWG